MDLLKLGGSIITKKEEYMKLNKPAIRKLAKVIAEHWKNGGKLILIHGAGSFGHAPVIKHGIAKGIINKEHKIGFADVHAACNRLSAAIVEELINNGIPAISLPPAVLVKQDNGKIMQFNEEIINEYLVQDYLPVLYGDMTLDAALGGLPCSGDKIISYLSKHADRIIFASNVDGVLADGKVVPIINKNNIDQVKKHLDGSSAPDVTGGMAKKIEEALSTNKTIYIVNGLKAKRVAALLAGNNTKCTKIEN